MRHLFRAAVAAQRRAPLGEGLLVGVGDASVMPVRIGPGQMQLTVMPSRPELDGERAGQAGDAGLGGGVGAVAAGGAERLGGGDVDDARRRATCAGAAGRRG